VFWIKRPEKLDLRFRLQKGNPEKAFLRERTAYHEMNAVQAPVPQVGADGPDFLVLPDCGLDLRRRLRREESAGHRRDLLLNASQSLGAFHSLGFAHGRPSPKDMCLVDDQVLLLDFERYQPQHNTPKGQARDLVIFAFNVAAHSPQMRGTLSEALAAYRATAPDGIWQRAHDMCRRLRWVNWVTKPLQMRPANKSREFKAIPVVLDLFAATA
jgi:tRNA A-37 threonylcarbamoyl transferase component Bud32